MGCGGGGRGGGGGGGEGGGGESPLVEAMSVLTTLFDWKSSPWGRPMSKIAALEGECLKIALTPDASPNVPRHVRVSRLGLVVRRSAAFKNCDWRTLSRDFALHN